MPTEGECVCCREVQEVDEIRARGVLQPGPCITEHDGFDAICLNQHVLRVAYLQYRQQYGERQGHEINE